MKITIPELSLVVLVGATSSGKSNFARKHFLPTEVVSSDACRALVADDENALDVNREAFDLLRTIASIRLGLRRIAVIDATNVQKEARKPLLEAARDNDVLAAAIVFDLPESVLRERSRSRSDRNVGSHVVRNQVNQLRRSLRDLQREGFRYVHVLRSPEEVDGVTIERQRLWTDRRDERGPFDLIGDVHGCHEELEALLERLGYVEQDSAYRHPDGRRVIFLGDLVDRGPDTPAVLRTVMAMVDAGTALCVPGNHDVKLMRALQGRQVKISHGLAESLAQLEPEPPEFRQRVVSFIDGLISHMVLDGGQLVAAHAGMAERLQGRASRRVRDFALYGETTGETDEFGLPVRYNWAGDYRGKAMVVYGHTPVPQAEWLNNTICLDTGCVYGGRLTALRYPERELVDVAASRMHYEPVRPLAAEATATGSRENFLLDITDVLGRRAIATRLSGNVTVPEESAAAALEVMSRFAVDPRWLVYLPPTMSPPSTTIREGLLEYPTEAFDYYRRNGIMHLVCEEKHMGSRAIAVIGRDSTAIERRFNIGSAAAGIVYTRTGRRFFSDAALEQAVLDRLRAAIDSAGLWSELNSDWVLLDAELMPWSAKAGELLLTQYAAVGSAAEQAFESALAALATTPAEVGAGELQTRTKDRAGLIHGYREAYGRYCWDVCSADDLRIAPFHLLASEAAVHCDRDHMWHMSTLARLASEDPMVVATAHTTVDLGDAESEAAATAWWEQLTARGGEGMVIKPLGFVTTDKRGPLQPAIKCRGPEYLRIIYGPEYTLPANLSRLRERSLGLKRSLAAREFSLGIEALERFVHGEGLYRVHECVFGVLAMESEAVDPRL